MKPASLGAVLTDHDSLLERLQDSVAERPDAMAVVDSLGGRLTRSQLLEEAGRVADMLRDAGAGLGDPVVIVLPNTVNWEVAFVACLLAGAVPATMPLTSDAVSVIHACRLIGARVLVAPPGDKVATWKVSDVVSALEERVAVVECSDAGNWALGADADDSLPRADLEGISHVMFTSSTTGLPKAVGHTEGSLAAVNEGFARRFALRADTPVFMASPLGHSVGAWHGVRLSLFVGSPLVLQHRWEPVEAINLIEAHSCRFTAAATPFLLDMVEAVEHGAEAPSSLATFLCGGAPVPPSLVERACRALPRTFVTVLWGMTEGGVTTCLSTDQVERVMSSAGVGLPGLELSAANGEGARLAPGEQGEIVMRGPGLFATYVGQADLYRDSLTPEGWFRTGDLGTVDDDGYLHLSGRLKDLIIRGGVNISPLPVEEAIAAHPAVRHVAVIGYPDERLGERIGAVVVPEAKGPTLQELVSWCEEAGLPKRWLPERLWLLDSMPTTPAGKIRKAVLRSLVSEDVSSEAAP